MMREVSALGVTMVDVRAQTTDARGILRPEYAYDQDHVHANDAFGEIVLRKFGEMLKEEDKTPSPPPEERAGVRGSISESSGEAPSP